MKDFRCLGCGALADVGEVPKGTLTLLESRGRPGPPCAACGGRNWVLCGTTTEFYRWTRRQDVCAVGGHVATGAVEKTLLPRQPPPPSGPAILGLRVRVCPDHLPELRAHGVNGFYLPDGE